MMIAGSVREAVVDYLSSEPQFEGAAIEQRTSAWSSKIGVSRPTASRENITLRSANGYPEGQLVFVEVTTLDGKRASGIVKTWTRDVKADVGTDQSRSDEGPQWTEWEAEWVGGAVGRSTNLSEPRLDFRGGWNDEVFQGGGEIVGASAEQARKITMTFANKRSAESHVIDGVAFLSVAGKVTVPARVDIIDGTGALLSSYEEF